ncbi:MAG: hypothetical protein R3B49_02655 [Phycisphaerales bacterium]
MSSTRSTGETERFGVPPSAVVDARPLDPDEPVELIDEAIEEEDEIAAELSELTRRERGLSFNPLDWVRGPAATALIVVFAAALVLFVTSQVIGVLADIQSLSEPIRWGVYGLIAVALGAIGYGLLRLVFAFARFKASPRYSFRAIQELATRAQLRENAHADLDAATRELCRMLREYPAQTDEHRAQLVRLGFKPVEADELSAARARLLEEYGEISPRRGWNAIGPCSRAGG